MIKRALILIVVAVAGWFLISFTASVPEQETLPLLAEQYVSQGAGRVGSANIVTAVVVTFRGLDTLGEVAVLFIATAGIGFLMRLDTDKGKRRTRTPASELLQTGSGFLIPLIILFGVYIFLHGHLTPGGGFQGGVVIASAVLLMLLARTDPRINHTMLRAVESLSGAFYVGIGVLGLILAAGFLDSRILPAGTLGALASAGAIPVIYSLIGLKVGSELVSILDTLHNAE